ncbi:MAG: hypothetical protein ABW318_06270 [Vicinamibacterales bacterium]
MPIKHRGRRATKSSSSPYEAAAYQRRGVFWSLMNGRAGATHQACREAEGAEYQRQQGVLIHGYGR